MAGGRDDARDHRQDQQAEDVVDDRGAEDDPREGRTQGVRVLEHARGDPDARRGEHGAQEGVQHPRLLGAHQLADPEPEQHGRDDADDGHERGPAADRHHLLRRRFQAHVEEQQDRAELGHDRQRLARSQRRQVGSAEERGVSGQDPNDQLAEHGGLAQALDQLPGELRADDGEGQGQQDGRDGVGVVAGAGGGQWKESVHAVLRWRETWRPRPRGRGEEERL